MSEAKIAVPFVTSSPDPEVSAKAQRRKFTAEDKKRILEELDRAPGFLLETGSATAAQSADQREREAAPSESAVTGRSGEGRL